jgi:sugar phosphate isomerase/epimerase
VSLDRFSLNQRTIASWTVEEVVSHCARAGVPSVGLWREPVAETGLERSATLVREAGLRVSSLCRGGFFTTAEPAQRAAVLEDNQRAIDEAATLGAACLVLVVGGLPPGSTDLPGAREQVRDVLAQLAPYAGERGVRLALEPMHPIFCSDRGVLSTLDQALDLAEGFPAEQVGVVVDAYHVWWDPRAEAAIARAAGRIASFQVSDWVVPLPADNLLGRGLPGDGCIDLRRLRRVTDEAGYTGDIEVEVFNAEVWARPGPEVLDNLLQRHRKHVL